PYRRRVARKRIAPATPATLDDAELLAGLELGFYYLAAQHPPLAFAAIPNEGVVAHAALAARESRIRMPTAPDHHISRGFVVDHAQDRLDAEATPPLAGSAGVGDKLP